jgi:hypothetical protein
VIKVGGYENSIAGKRMGGNRRVEVLNASTTAFERGFDTAVRLAHSIGPFRSQDLPAEQVEAGLKRQPPGVLSGPSEGIIHLCRHQGSPDERTRNRLVGRRQAWWEDLACGGGRGPAETLYPMPSREAAITRLLAHFQRAPNSVAGLDFAFSFPAWFLTYVRVTNAWDLSTNTKPTCTPFQLLITSVESKAKSGLHTARRRLASRLWRTIACTKGWAMISMTR